MPVDMTTSITDHARSWVDPDVWSTGPAQHNAGSDMSTLVSR